MTKVYIILRNSELYHGSKVKPKSVKAFTSLGIAEGVLKRDIAYIASEMHNKMDIKPVASEYETEVYERLFMEVEKEFEIREVEL